MPNRCHMCKVEEESTDHLLLHCHKAGILWQLVFSLFGVVQVMHFIVRGSLLSWRGSFMGKKQKKKEKEKEKEKEKKARRATPLDAMEG